MSKLFKLTALLVSFCILMSGCSSSNEEKLKELASVQGIGIDYDDGKYGVSMMIYDISKTSGSSSQLSGNLTRVFYDTSDSIPGAIANMSGVIGKRSFFSHNRVVVVGEEMAVNGIDAIMDMLYRNPEIRPYILIAVARGKASDIMKATFGDALNPSKEIQDIIKTASYYSNVSETELVDVAIMTYEDTSDVYMPILEIAEDGEAKFVKARGIAIFKDRKLVGELDENESRGLLWINGLIKSGNLDCETESGIKVSSAIVSSDTDVTVNVNQEGKICYKIKVECILDMEQLDMKNNDRLSIDDIEEMETAYKGVIKSQIYSALQKCILEYESDVFRFGKRLWKAYPDLYRDISDNWNEYLSELLFSVDIEVKIGRSGEEIVDYK